MRVLVITQGEYGQRMVRNLQQHAPTDWQVHQWEAPVALPMVIDYPEDYLPEVLPEVDLILSLAENPGIAELIPEVAKRTGAKAVVAPVDRNEWLPKGLARQLAGWLQDIGVNAVFPKPLCSLTETHYGSGRRKVPYSDERISEFAQRFGRPRFAITVDPAAKTIIRATAERDAVCGCARYVAQGLIGTKVDDAEFNAGMLHHHYPCLAAMGIDSEFGDTLMHVSGNIAKDEVKEQVRPYLATQYFAPHGRVEEGPGNRE